MLVYWNHINIYVDNKKVIDPNFVYNNETYIPIDSITSLLNISTVWNEYNNTIHIIDK